MRLSGGRAVAVALALAGGALLLPGMGLAQTGFFVTPSFSVGEVYDDNLFSTPSGRQRDWISRFSPGVQAGYQSAPFTLLGRYTFDAEVFAEHSELTTAQARQEGSLEVRYLPYQLLTLAFTGTYAQSLTPGELNTATGLAAGRARAERVSYHPSVSYQFDPLTVGTAEYTLAEDEVSGGVDTRSHVADLVLDRRLTPRDRVSGDYSFRHFVFGGDGETTSHGFLLGWTHEFTPLTGITLRGGPRFTGWSVAPEVSATIRHRLKMGEVSFVYSRSQTTAIGEVGAVNTETFAATATYQPLRGLRLRAAPGLLRSTRGGAEAKVYAVTCEASYELTKWLSLAGSYSFSLQRGSLDQTRPAGEEIEHSIVLLKLVTAYPFRLY